MAKCPTCGAVVTEKDGFVKSSYTPEHVRRIEDVIRDLERNVEDSIVGCVLCGGMEGDHEEHCSVEALLLFRRPIDG